MVGYVYKNEKMQKPKENPFIDKFRLLNSQENTEKINWSCSDSSDYENECKNERLSIVPIGQRTRKRKRKKKVPKNICNLEIKILDVSRDDKDVSLTQKSPRVSVKRELTSQMSPPLLKPTTHSISCQNAIKIEPISPILSCNVRETRTKVELPSKSPVLTLKSSSPKFTPKVRKKLFKSKQNVINGVIADNCSVIDSQNILSKVHSSERLSNQDKGPITGVKIIKLDDNLVVLKESVNNTQDNKDPKSEELSTTFIKTEIKTDNSNLEDSFENPKTSSLDLAKKVRSYFESHFSSENNSQHSITVSLTPRCNSKTSDEIEILSSITQVTVERNNSETAKFFSNPSPASSESAEINSVSKKIRYKKNGLAYRLNMLLKKQNAKISLWQHERFLADNSNFIVPKEECVAFRIKKYNYRYGCYVLETVDINDDNFLILINSIYVSNSNFSQDIIFKLYEPFKILDYTSDCKLIVNVTKFECVVIKL